MASVREDYTVSGVCARGHLPYPTDETGKREGIENRMGKTIGEVVGVGEGGSYSFFSTNPYIDALYRQIEQRIDGLVFRRMVTIADLKTCGEGVIYYEGYGRKAWPVDRVILLRDNFARVFRRAVRRLPQQVLQGCGREGMPEVYATVMWFLSNNDVEINYNLIKDSLKAGDFSLSSAAVPAGFDFLIDLDLDENPWLSEDRGIEVVRDFALFIRDKLGIEPTILISKGVQLRVALLPIHVNYLRQKGIEWVRFVWSNLPEVHRRIAQKLVDEFSDGGGVAVKIDPQVYDAARITRLDLSVHAGIRAFSIPLTPSMLSGMTWTEIRRRQGSEAYVRAILRRYNGVWGRVIDASKYVRVLGFYMAAAGMGNIELRLVIPKVENNESDKVVSRGWRKIDVPGLGAIEYDARLEGFGWVQVLVREKIPMQDARTSMAWLVLPVAIAGPKTKSGRVEPLITRDEAIEWLRACLEHYPDPEGKTLDDYVKKLDYHLRYGEKYNIPTWRHLLDGRDEGGKPLNPAFLHIRDNALKALAQAGLVKTHE